MYDTLDTIRVQRTYIDSLQPTYHLQSSPNDTHSSLVEHRPLSIISVPANAPPPVFSNPLPVNTPAQGFSNPTPVFSNPVPVNTPAQVFSNPVPVNTPVQVFSNPVPVNTPTQVFSNPVPPNTPAQVFSNPVPVNTPAQVFSNPVHQLNQSHSIDQPQINEQITSLNNAILQLRQDHINQQKEIEYLKQLLASKEHYVEENEDEQNESPLAKDDIPLVNEPSPHDNITIHDFTDESIKEIYGTTLILFYTPTCPHCVTLKPLYTFMAPIFIKHNITVGMLNGAENRNTLREFKIQGVPTIVLIHNNERHVYQGPRVLKDIVHWVQHIVTNVDLNLIKDKSITISE
jgi:thiol-disulfide isomerase/thioredoxin